MDERLRRRIEALSEQQAKKALMKLVENSGKKPLEDFYKALEMVETCSEKTHFSVIELRNGRYSIKNVTKMPDGSCIEG